VYLPTLQKLLAAAGLEMRIHLEPIDYHDDVLEAFMHTLPPERRRDLEELSRARVARERLRRVRGT
jgi:hypothetical protein